MVLPFEPLVSVNLSMLGDHSDGHGYWIVKLSSGRFLLNCSALAKILVRWQIRSQYFRSLMEEEEVSGLKS